MVNEISETKNKNNRLKREPSK